MASVSSTLHSKVTLELTLLTFCPPGPELLEKLKLNSEKGMVIGVIRDMILT